MKKHNLWPLRLFTDLTLETLIIFLTILTNSWNWTILRIRTILIIFTFLAVHNSSIGLIVPRLLVCLLPPTIRLFITLQSDPRDFVTFETFIQTDFERLTDFWKSFSNLESFQTKTILRLVTFETLSTILTIENLCYPAIHFDTGQHAQFLRCFIIVTRPPQHYVNTMSKLVLKSHKLGHTGEKPLLGQDDGFGLWSKWLCIEFVFYKGLSVIRKPETLAYKMGGNN